MYYHLSALQRNLRYYQNNSFLSFLLLCHNPSLNATKEPVFPDYLVHFVNLLTQRDYYLKHILVAISQDHRQSTSEEFQ